MFLFIHRLSQIFINNHPNQSLWLLICVNLCQSVVYKNPSVVYKTPLWSFQLKKSHFRP